MKKCVLGIDLGTSSVKILSKYRDGTVKKLKNTYEKPLPSGWWKAVEDLLKQISWNEVEAIGLTSQVGTYLVNDQHVIDWNSSVGKEELVWWKNNYDQEKFIEEISMPHPEVISYPLPRLKYMKEHFDHVYKICQPKEYILNQLTGEWCTDEYSWRGLCNLHTKQYSTYFIQELEMTKDILPPVKEYRKVAGYTKEIDWISQKLPEGIPVYVGLNDYYAGLLGMGIGEPGQMFDVTGTSEHIGVLLEEMVKDTSLVSGPYLKHMVHYGVTASSGASVRYGLKLGNKDSYNMENIIKEKPPVFLPYLKGERAPIWNPYARGVFFGIEENCNADMMSYAIMEGVVFSLYHIFENMGKPPIHKITVSGGAANIEVLSQLKADIFGCSIEVVKEKDVSALGACIVAAVGEGWYDNIWEAAEAWVEISHEYTAQNQYSQWFNNRFEIYKELYRSVIPLYEMWKKL